MVYIAVNSGAARNAEVDMPLQAEQGKPLTDKLYQVALEASRGHHLFRSSYRKMQKLK
jgi:hypothetical protein